MPKMIDIGEKHSKMAVAESSGKYYPSITLSLKDFPSLKDVEVGDKVSFLAEGVVESIRNYKSENSQSNDLGIKVKRVAADEGDSDSFLDYIKEMSRKK